VVACTAAYLQVFIVAFIVTCDFLNIFIIMLGIALSLQTFYQKIYQKKFSDLGTLDPDHLTWATLCS